MGSLSQRTQQALQGQAARPEAALVHLLVQHICDSLVLYIGVRDIDPVHEQYDQTGMHLNEAGSKNMPTLSLPDQELIPILEDHMQTRSRISWVTCTFSSLSKAKRKPPLEVLLKAKTEQILKKLRLPPGRRYTLQVGPKGSYREEQMITFLERHLPEWSETRDAEHDYRILGLDAYAPHKSQRIVRLAWSRGYVSGSGSMVPAGGTGLVAGPDTDVHAWLENELQELQSMSAHNKLLERPHAVPSEKPQDMIDHAVMLWEFFDHTLGERSFKRNGLSNSLDGTEDFMIDRDAKTFWEEMAMRERLKLVRCEVEAYIAAKGGVQNASAKDVFNIIQDYDSVQGGIGHMEEGQECEAALKHGEAVFEIEAGDAHDVDYDLKDGLIPVVRKVLRPADRAREEARGRGVPEGHPAGHLQDASRQKSQRLQR